jgi:mannose-6-phosphate isomerase-like protein (cupin superfamily)
MTTLAKHANYLAVVAAAEHSFRNSRSLEAIRPEIILLARLYCYGFRGQVIGAFHATAQALEKRQAEVKTSLDLENAYADLRALANISLEFIPTDYRAVLSTFNRYDLILTRVVETLQRYNSGDLSKITARFIAAMLRITGSSGIVVTRDDENPKQASFVVPSLGITIVPLVYGDHHSWNLAFLAGENLNVPRHRHMDGVEIHLGYGEMRGRTLLGGYSAAVNEGYAMPIPPGTPHGFVNDAGHDHLLPFIFGSRRLGGWGIVPDVEPQPMEIGKLQPVDVLSKEMNGTILLDRELERAVDSKGTSRRTLISAEQTHTSRSGGISLSVAKIGTEPVTYAPERFQIISVNRGGGIVTIGQAIQAIGPHDHFGIPAGVTAVITSSSDEPLVVLDSVLIEDLNSTHQS